MTAWAHELFREGDWSGDTTVIVGGDPLTLDALPSSWWHTIDELAESGMLNVIATNSRAAKLPHAIAFTIDHGFARGEEAATLGNPVRIGPDQDGAPFDLPPGWTLLKRRRHREGRQEPRWPWRLAAGIPGANTGTAALAFADCMHQGHGSIYAIGFRMADPERPSRASTYDRWRNALEYYAPYIRTPVYLVGESTLSAAFPRREFSYA